MFKVESKGWPEYQKLLDHTSEITWLGPSGKARHSPSDLRAKQTIKSNCSSANVTWLSAIVAVNDHKKDLNIVNSSTLDP